jgi:hypothetical protein
MLTTPFGGELLLHETSKLLFWKKIPIYGNKIQASRSQQNKQDSGKQLVKHKTTALARLSQCWYDQAVQSR